MKMHRTFMAGNISDAEKRLVFDANVPAQSPEETAQLRARVENLEAELKTKEQVIEAQQKALMQIDTMNKQLELQQQQIAALQSRAESDPVENPRRIAVQSISRRQGEYLQVLPRRYEFQTRNNRFVTPIRTEELPAKKRTKEPPYEGKIRTQYVKDHPGEMGRMVRQQWQIDENGKGSWAEVGVIHSQADMQANADAIHAEREQQEADARANARRVIKQFNRNRAEATLYDEAGWTEASRQRTAERNRLPADVYRPRPDTRPDYMYVDRRGVSQNYAQDTYERYKAPSQPRAEGPDWMQYESGNQDVTEGWARVNGELMRVVEDKYSGATLQVDSEMYEKMRLQSNALLHTEGVQGTLSGRKIGAVSRKPADGVPTAEIQGSNGEIHISCPNKETIIMKLNMTKDEKNTLRQKLSEQGLIVELLDPPTNLRNGWKVRITPSRKGEWQIRQYENGNAKQAIVLQTEKEGEDNPPFTPEEIRSLEEQLKKNDENRSSPALPQNNENEGVNATVNAPQSSTSQAPQAAPAQGYAPPAKVATPENDAAKASVLFGAVDREPHANAQKLVVSGGFSHIRIQVAGGARNIVVDTRGKTGQNILQDLQQEGLILQMDRNAAGVLTCTITPTRKGQWNVYGIDPQERHVPVGKITNNFEGIQKSNLSFDSPEHAKNARVRNLSELFQSVRQPNGEITFTETSFKVQLKTIPDIKTLPQAPQWMSVKTSAEPAVSFHSNDGKSIWEGDRLDATMKYLEQIARQLGVTTVQQAPVLPSTDTGPTLPSQKEPPSPAVVSDEIARVKKFPLELASASSEVKDSFEVVLSAVKQVGQALAYASDNLKNNKEIVLTAVSGAGLALEYASENLRSDKEVVLAAVSQEAWALQYASENLRSDKEVVLAAVSQGGWALQYASENLRSDKEVVLAAVRQNGASLQYANFNLQNDEEVVLAAVSQEGSALECANKSFRSDKNFMLQAIAQNAWALEYASDSLRNDKDFVLAAVTKNGWVLEHASDKLKNNREIVLAAITTSAGALLHASETLKKDKNIVLEAVKKDGFALQFASEELRNNKEVVMEAVSRNGLSLEFASEQLRDDMEVVRKAVNFSSDALQYASERIRNNPTLLKKPE